MEKLLTVVLSVLELFWRVVLQVTIGATLTRLVSLIALRPHGLDVLNAALNNCPINAWHAEDKLEQIPQLFLLIAENILKPEEVDRLVCVLSQINPVVEPVFIALSGPLLEICPEGVNVMIEQTALELCTMTLCVYQVEEGGGSIELVSCADNSNI